MKRLILIFLFCLPAAQPQAQVVVFDPVAEIVNVLQLAEKVIQTKQQYDQLVNISGLADLVAYLDLAEFAQLREHLPDKFMDVLKAASDVEGGIQAIDELLIALDGWDVDSEWSRDNALQELYKYQMEHIQQSSAFAAADYESAAQSIKKIDSSIGTSTSWDSQKQRDQGQLQATAEAAKANYRIVQSMAQLIDLMSAERVEDIAIQKRFSEATADRDAYTYKGNK